MLTPLSPADILIENAYCEGTHGISIGSLGQYAAETDIVAHVVARNVTMAGGQNGARIKVRLGRLPSLLEPERDRAPR